MFAGELQALSLSLSDVVIPPGARMACFDLKDFFLSGSSSEIANDVSSAFSGPKASLIKEATSFLLGHQYVVAESLLSLPHVYRCILGGKKNTNIAQIRFQKFIF